MTVRQGWLLLIAAFVAFRVFMPAVLRPVGYIADWNDYAFFEGWARLTDRGLYPYLNFWMEHPPLFPWLVVGVYRLAALLPAWQGGLLTFSTLFGLVLLIFEVGNLILVGRLAGRVAGAEGGLRAAWVWALLFGPVFFWSAGFEGYPLFFLLLALDRGLRSGRRWALAAGVAAGIGMMVKLLPALALPALVFWRWRTGRRIDAALIVGAALVTSVAILTPFATANPTMLRASATSLVSRPGWETVFALADGYSSGGAVARPETRLDPATASIADHPSSVPTWPALAAALAFGAFTLWRIRRWTDQTVLLAAAFTVALFLLANKGYSPQFIVYLLAALLIAWPNGRVVAYCLAFSAINLIEYPLALLLFSEQPAVIWVAVLSRTLLLAILAADLAGALTGWRIPRLERRSAAVAATALALVLLGTLGSATASFADRRTATDAQADAVRLLRDRRAPVLFSDRGLYDRLTPQLRGAAETRLAHEAVPPRLPDGAREVWQAYVDSDEGRRLAPRVAAALSDAFLVEQRIVSDLDLRRYLIATPPTVQISGELGGVRLSRLRVSTEAGDVLPIGLTWQGTATATLKRFVHLVDGSGTLVAQRDDPADVGTEDRVGLVVANVPPGEYRLRIGLYDGATGARLSGPAGDSIDAGAIRIRR